MLGAGVADARVPAHPFSYEAEAEAEPQIDELPVALMLTLADEEPEHRFRTLGASLVSGLELGAMDLPMASMELGWADTSFGPSDDIQPLSPIIHTISIGPLKGALLDQCRFRMRKVGKIGKGASPDGRPASCRLLYFAGRQAFRDRGARRRRGLRLRFGSSMRPLMASAGPLPMLPPPAPAGSHRAPIIARPIMPFFMLHGPRR